MSIRKSEDQQDALRRKCRQARARLSGAERDKATEKICDAVSRSGFFRSSHKIACYIPSDEEVDTWPLIARAFTMGKQVFAPVLRKKGQMAFRKFDEDSDLAYNRFGLLEPQSGEYADPRTLDIVITPLVAFDASRNRVGMGSGYFDRSFSFLKSRKTWLHPKLIGVAFECQRVNKVVPNAWDIGLFRVFTEKT